MSFKQVFRILPKEIEDMVFEFNADHRELMKPVLLDLVTFHTCIICEMPIWQSDYRTHANEFCSLYCYGGGVTIYCNFK